MAGHLQTFPARSQLFAGALLASILLHGLLLLTPAPRHAPRESVEIDLRLVGQPLMAAPAPGTQSQGAGAKAARDDPPVQRAQSPPAQVQPPAAGTQAPSSRAGAAPRAKKQTARQAKALGQTGQTVNSLAAANSGAEAANAPQGVKAASEPVPGEYAPKPEYPQLARKRGQQGKVLVRCLVDAAGGVRQANIASSSGHRLLDEEALRTVRKWRFKPAMRAGAAVEGFVVVPVVFKLK